MSAKTKWEPSKGSIEAARRAIDAISHRDAKSLDDLTRMIAEAAIIAAVAADPMLSAAVEMRDPQQDGPNGKFSVGDMVYVPRDRAKYELVGVRGCIAFVWLEEQDYGRMCKASELLHADEDAP